MSKVFLSTTLVVEDRSRKGKSAYIERDGYINIIYILKGKGFTIYIIIVITLRWWIQLCQWHEDDELIEISFIGLEAG